MPCYMVVGGQFGSEGKGKVINAIIRTCIEEGAKYHVVRCGGANSGHTTLFDGKEVIVKQLPSAIHDPNAILYIGAGCVINRLILVDEIKRFKIPRDRLYIDPRAVILNDDDCEIEKSTILDSLGSTASGTGAALARRVMRGRDVALVEYDDVLPEYAHVGKVAPFLHAALATVDGNDEHECVIVEGTQGFGLSLLHGCQYPFLTGRDVTASGFASEVGLPPALVDEVIMVVRTWPIRVGGNSGPLNHECSWEDVAKSCGGPTELEYTSVTNRLRRVGKFDIELVREACDYNSPTCLALMGMDRIDAKDRGVRSLSELSPASCEAIRYLENETGVGVRYIGTGPRTEDMIVNTSR